MKAHLIIFLALISILFASCDLNSESNNTPALVMGPFILNGDTLKINSKNNISVLDIISVGDTVSVTLKTNGYTNNLTKLGIYQSKDDLTSIEYPPMDSLIIFPQRESIASIFTEASDYNNGYFEFTGLLNHFQFTFKYIAKKPSQEASLKIYVASDAAFEYNTSGMEITTPIVEKK